MGMRKTRDLVDKRLSICSNPFQMTITAEIYLIPLLSLWFLLEGTSMYCLTNITTLQIGVAWQKVLLNIQFRPKCLTIHINRC